MKSFNRSKKFIAKYVISKFFHILISLIINKKYSTNFKENFNKKKGKGLEKKKNLIIK